MTPVRGVLREIDSYDKETWITVIVYSLLGVPIVVEALHVL